MDILAFPLWLVALAVVVALVVWYTWHMSKDLNIFERLGAPGPPPYPILGNLGLRYWMDGVFVSQVDLYQRYKDKKLYGTFDANVPVLHIADPDMIHDVLVTHFRHFEDRPHCFQGDPFLDSCLNYLHGNDWSRTRQIFDSVLNGHWLTNATSAMQRAADALVVFLKPKIDWRRRVELRDLASCYAIDVHTNILLGGDHKTFDRINSKNYISTKELLGRSKLWWISSPFFPFMPTLLRMCRISAVSSSALKFFKKRVNGTLHNAVDNGNGKNGKQWVSNLMSEVASDLHIPGLGSTKGKHCVTHEKLIQTIVQTHGFTLIHSGLSKVSSVLSLTLFLLANHPEELQTVQNEIDEHVGAKSPDETMVEKLKYLDQCIYETLRLFPSQPTIDRVCTKEIKTHGVVVPENMVLRVPVYALHHDPEVWGDDHDDFRPGRFDRGELGPWQSGVYLPFGLGPRNCPGERFAMVEIKLAIVSLLRIASPIPCAQSPFPIVPGKWRLLQDSSYLWVKLRPRFWSL